MELLSRKRALQLGQTDYYTGKPCARGHKAPRRVADWRCRECAREDAKMYAHKRGKPTTSSVSVRVPREQRSTIAKVGKAMREGGASVVVAELPEALRPHFEQIIKDMGGKLLS